MQVRELLRNEYAPLRALRPTAVYQFNLTLTRWAAQLGREPALEDLKPLPVQAGQRPVPELKLNVPAV